MDREGPGIGAETSPLKEGGGGFFPNIDNNYERDLLSRTFGKVVVAKGKLPDLTRNLRKRNGHLACNEHVPGPLHLVLHEPVTASHDGDGVCL